MDAFDTLFIPQQFPDSRISGGKKKNLRISASMFDHVRNDLVSRSLIRIVEKRKETKRREGFESVARSSAAGLFNLYTVAVRREARVLRGPKGWLMNGQLIHENHRRVVLGARVLRYTAKPPKIQPSTRPPYHTVLFKECLSSSPFPSLFPSLRLFPPRSSPPPSLIMIYLAEQHTQIEGRGRGVWRRKRREANISCN